MNQIQQLIESIRDAPHDALVVAGMFAVPVLIGLWIVNRMRHPERGLLNALVIASVGFVVVPWVSSVAPSASLDQDRDLHRGVGVHIVPDIKHEVVRSRGRDHDGNGLNVHRRRRQTRPADALTALACKIAPICLIPLKRDLRVHHPVEAR